jgi:peptidoglycan hydrolase-like protein with peptidoglycan-binding domain
MAINLPKVVDAAYDTWEDVTSDQTSRTGHSAARVASSLANGVDPEVVALQATLNSKKNNPDASLTFSSNEMIAVAKWHTANQTRSAFTKRQAGAVIREQRAADGDYLSPSVV